MSLAHVLDGSVAKGYTHGVHRSRRPAETFQAISKHFATIGLTRIADVTGLDTIGIPVCVAVRPNSRSLSVSQGKGLTLEQARVSAAMESIETHHAEFATLPLRTGPYRELAQTMTVCDPATLNLHPRSLYHADLPLQWVSGFDMMQRREILVPHDLVHCSFLRGSNRAPLFSMSSNGLASGNHLLEAISHGLCEIVERDAAFFWEWRVVDPKADTGLVDLSTVDSAPCRALLETLERAGVSAYVWDQTSDVGIPTFACAIIEHRPERLLLALGPYTGFGCHLSKEIALIRAITEAAQSRLTHISGARDDMFRSSYLTYKSDQIATDMTTRISQGRASVDFNSLPSLETDTLEGDVAIQLAMLKRAGFDRAIVVDLSDPAIGIPVVRVIVPGMEFRAKHEALLNRLGSRTKERLLKQDLTRLVLRGRA
jgi:YcaO-like protein with predicted kinase domain